MDIRGLLNFFPHEQKLLCHCFHLHLCVYCDTEHLFCVSKDSTSFLEAGNNGDPFLRFQNGVWLIGTALREA